ncbi:MAG: sigma-70 family RNA polymerase sigma factor [Eubacterium sp.]|nr:sigma-70 family RNA polymerase sigma factor [Eubacterium sp.]
MTDEEIIRLFHDRDQESIEEAFRKYGAKCRHISKNILGNPLDAEECMNDLGMALWQSIPPDEPKSLEAYMISVARNLAHKRYRDNHAGKRNSAFETVLDELENLLPAVDTVESQAMADELLESLQHFLQSQSVTDRKIFMRRFWMTDSIKDIAGEMNLSVTAVSLRLHRTKKKLREYLKKEGF